MKLAYTYSTHLRTCQDVQYEKQYPVQKQVSKLCEIYPRGYGSWRPAFFRYLGVGGRPTDTL